jgi:hypothetical protein
MSAERCGDPWNRLKSPISRTRMTIRKTIFLPNSANLHQVAGLQDPGWHDGPAAAPPLVLIS